MIISTKNHWPTGRTDQRPCTDKRGAGCPDEIIASMFTSATSNSRLRNDTIRFWMENQTERAIIYVVMVVLFYMAIIILLLGTNGRRARCHQTRSKHRICEFLKRQTLAVYGRNSQTKIVKTTHKSLKGVPSDDPKKITPL